MNFNNESTNESKFESIRNIAASENINKQKILGQIKKTLNEFYSETKFYSNVSLSDFYFATISLDCIEEEIITIKTINYISDVLGNHTKKFLSQAQITATYEYIKDNLETINASIDSTEINEYKGNKTLFSSGILHRFQKQNRNNTLNELITQGKKAYKLAANKNYTKHSEILHELADHFEYVREKTEILADKFIFSQKNEYSMNAFLQALGNNPLKTPTEEQRIILLRNWNNVN